LFSPSRKIGIARGIVVGETKSHTTELMFEESPRFWIDAKKLNIYILNSFLEERLNPNSGEVLFSFFLHSSMIKSGAHELF